MKNDAARLGRALGTALGRSVNHLIASASRCDAREDAIVEAFRLSDREHSYEEIRDRLFRERGLDD